MASTSADSLASSLSRFTGVGHAVRCNAHVLGHPVLPKCNLIDSPEAPNDEKAITRGRTGNFSTNNLTNTG